MFTIPPAALSAITGLLLPVLVALITRTSASTRLKVVTNLLASAVAALLLNAANEAGYAVLSWAAVGAWAQQTAIAIAAYLGVYKPLGAPAVLLPTIGLGGRSTPDA